MGLVNDLADRFEGATGLDSTGAIENADDPAEAVLRYQVGGLSYAESVVSGVTGSSEQEVRNDHVARGGVRNLLDTVYEYEGTWGGTADSVDLAGPAAWGTEGSVRDVLVDEQGETSSPEETKTKLLLGGVLVLVVLYLVRPLLEVAAGVTGE